MDTARRITVNLEGSASTLTEPTSKVIEQLLSRQLFNPHSFSGKLTQQATQAANFLQSAGCDKLAVIGFCWGGFDRLARFLDGEI